MRAEGHIKIAAPMTLRRTTPQSAIRNPQSDSAHVTLIIPLLHDDIIESHPSDFHSDASFGIPRNDGLWEFSHRKDFL